MRFLHTADWHIGKVYRFLDDGVEARVAEARLDAITAIGQAARAEGVTLVLVAGDVFDHRQPTRGTLARPLERMSAFPEVQWHLIPGNHDRHRPDGVWDRFLGLEPPPHVRVHLAPGPVELGAGVVLLPAPPGRAGEDPTRWMDQVATPPGTFRLGLAHGAVRDFGEAPTVIAIDRAARAGLDWLALGDWHQELRLGPRTAYSGTPEPDRFGQARAGRALLVDLPAPGAPPETRSLPIGSYRWLGERATLKDATDIERLAARIRDLAAPDPARVLVDLRIEGALTFEDLRRFRDRIADQGDGGRLRSALAWLQVDLGGLGRQPTPDDLDAIARTGGAVRDAAARLLEQTRAGDPERRHLAERALLHLHAAQQRGARP